MSKVQDGGFPTSLDKLTAKVKAEKAQAFQKGKGKNEIKDNYTEEGYGEDKKPGFRKRKAGAKSDENQFQKKPKTDPQGNGEKPNWKEMRAEKKQLKEARKKKKNVEIYELSKDWKIMWEELRQTNCPKDRREVLSKKLFSNLKDHLKKIVLSHDMVRVVECLVAVGGDNIRTEIFENLKEDLLSLLTAKYGNFLVKKLLTYCTKKQRSQIIESFTSNVVKLMKNPISAPIVDYAFTEYATPVERVKILQEFCAPDFRHYKDTENPNTFAKFLDKRPERLPEFLKNMKHEALKIIAKGPWKFWTVHTLLQAYMTRCDEASRAELIELLQDQLVNMMHTKQGTEVAMLCLWHGTAKNRKIIVKSFKTHVEKICTTEESYMAMLAVFDCVDDTLLVSKALLQEMMESLDTIMQSACGRKVITYLMAPRSPSLFHPQQIQILAAGDENKHSKKDKEVRQKELLQNVEEDLASAIARNIGTLLENDSVVWSVKTILTAMDGPHLQNVHKNLITLAVKADSFKDFMKESVFKLFKAIILQDKERKLSTNYVRFSDLILDNFDGTQTDTFDLKPWLEVHRGSVLFCVMLETKIEDLVTRVTKLLKRDDGKYGCYMKFLQKDQKENRGAQSLMELVKKGK